MDKNKRIIDFDIKDLLKKTAESDMMEGLSLPENIRVDQDEVKASIRIEEDTIYFALTYIDACNNKEKSESYADELLFDLWKNYMIDEAYKMFREKIEAEFMDKNLYLSPLLGPGYYEMPLSDAGFICEKADARSIGITCHESGSMSPAFSRCGFFTISSEADSSRLSACKSCKGNRLGCSMCSLFTAI